MYPTQFVGLYNCIDVMPVPATAHGSPDVREKEQIMTTPEHHAPTERTAPARNSWREIVQTGADIAQIEGFALEHLIDLQRERAHPSGERR